MNPGYSPRDERKRLPCCARPIARNAYCEVWRVETPDGSQYNVGVLYECGPDDMTAVDMTPALQRAVVLRSALHDAVRKTHRGVSVDTRTLPTLWGPAHNIVLSAGPTRHSPIVDVVVMSWGLTLKYEITRQAQCPLAEDT
jgi:predicted nucleic acid-binding Zn ribbon protein